MVKYKHLNTVVTEKGVLCDYTPTNEEKSWNAWFFIGNLI